MSVFSDKRVFGIKRQNCGGVSTAGQVCANDVILWVIFLLPINIVYMVQDSALWPWDCSWAMLSDGYFCQSV